MSKIYSVHFLNADYRSSHGVEKPWKIGETRTVKGDLALCESGYHYCHDWGSALLGGYLYGPIACIVQVDDRGPTDKYKGVSATRTLVEAYDVTKVLQAFALECADRAVRIHAVKALRKAGLKEQAAILAAFFPIVDVATANSARDAANSARYAAADSASYAADSASYAADSATYAADSASFAAYSASSAVGSARFAAGSARFAANSASSAAGSASFAERTWQAKRFEELLHEATGWRKA